MNINNMINETLLGKYKIMRKLTEGGMDSDIYLARNTKCNTKDYIEKKSEYAIVKIVKKTQNTSDDQWSKILDEVLTTGRVSTKRNIIKLYDYCKPTENTIAIIMEYIDGKSLLSYLNDKSRLEPLEAIWIFGEILIAIKDLHSNKRIIIHRDLKPENILLSKDLTKVKLIDFGISSVIHKSNLDDNFDILTNENEFYGTIPYISPDILKFKNRRKEEYGNLITKQFDFFSLGIIFYELLTGQKPFKYEDQDNPQSIKIALEYDIPTLKKYDPILINDLENIIIRLVASNKNRVHLRYNDVDEIIKDLEKCRQKYLNNNLIEEELLIPLDERHLQENIISNEGLTKLSIIKNLNKKCIIFISISSIILGLGLLFLILSLVGVY